MMSFVRSCAPFLVGSACWLGLSVPALAQGYDAIGLSTVSTVGKSWLFSFTNTDVANDASTAVGQGTVVVPAGRRPTEFWAVVGTRGPLNAANTSLDLLNVQSWEVHFWTSRAAALASPYAGNIKVITYVRPDNPGFNAPYSTDVSNRPTFIVKFRLPGNINLPQGQPIAFAVRSRQSFANAGTLGVCESTFGGLTGTEVATSLPTPGWVDFNSLPFATSSGTFAYRVIAGCLADLDNNSITEVSDIFAFLSLWFANTPGGDYDGNGLIEVADIFAFLSGWFGGC